MPKPIHAVMCSAGHNRTLGIESPTLDDLLGYAADINNSELWRGRLPVLQVFGVGTYRWDGERYLPVCRTCGQVPAPLNNDGMGGFCSQECRDAWDSVAHALAGGRP